MAEYLCPNIQLSVEEKRQIFQIRSQINPLPPKRGKQVFCLTGCGDILDNSHILLCKVLNEGEQGSNNNLINGDINAMKSELFKWNQCMKKMEEYSTLDPDPILYIGMSCCDIIKKISLFEHRS